ncbi:MAG: phosphoribosylglycinamide formyltransferase [Candidatus Neomarinimicrobiota bacterium]
MKNISVFASGRGSNFSAILDKIQKGEIPARVACVISENEHPPVFDIAAAAGIPTYCIHRKQFAAPEDYAGFLLRLLQKEAVDLIVLAGFLKLIPTPVVRQFPHAIVNIHPALLPNFGGQGFFGMKVHEAVIASGIKVTGVTIHFVDEHYDTGAIICQEKVDVLASDTPESLAHRVLQVEHRLYPAAVKALCEDKIKVIDRKVVWNQ